MDARRPHLSDRHEHDAQERHSDAHILHQPVALPPGTRTIHGPDGLLGSHTLPPVTLLPPPINQQLPPPQPYLPAPISSHQNAVMIPGPPPPTLPPFNQHVQNMNATQQPILNDALSYLDQVKVQFQAHPDVYNRFLDIMKEFKSGSIDTPGVIERVSQLFAGHPNLIQGFNTFLPPGYKIECGMGDDPNSIRVTTPMGTTQSVLPGRPPSRSYMSNTGNLLPPPPHHYAEPNNVVAWQQQHHPRDTSDHVYAHENRLPPPAAFAHGNPATFPGPSNVGMGEPHRELPPIAAALDQRTLPPIHQSVQALSRHAGQIAASAGEALAMAPLAPLAPLANGAGEQLLAEPGAEKRGPVEFNHAINYVNKIKNRFASQPDIYKQFLEILQTYQRESKPIGDVYTQVTRLFDSAPDLLEDFKQFLPESAAHANAVAAARAEAQFPTSNTRTDPAYQVLAAQVGPQQTPRAEPSRLPPMGNFAPTPSSSKDKRKRGEKAAPSGEQVTLGGRAGVVQAAPASKKQKTTGKTITVAEVDPLTVQPSLVPAMPAPLQAQSTSATPDDIQMFDKIRKDMSNKAQFSEFIKLVNLFNQDLITGSYCLYRAKQFIDPNSQSFVWLKTLLGNPQEDGTITNKLRDGVSSARISLSKCRSFGPSYRLLPKQEHNQLCSGRDELCKSVLNDEWVSHPTWESEEAGFVAHKKTLWEETLHRIEEERHDYDSNIEALNRTIQLLEPYVLSLDLGREIVVDRKLGGQSEFIHKRTIFKLYGREHGHTVIDRLFANPKVVIPPLYARLKDVREKWKAGQRSWNEIWRQQMNQNYDKSLDPQGVTAKGTADKRQFQPKTLHSEARARKDGNVKPRTIAGLSLHSAPLRSDYQFAYEFTNEQVLSDTLRLIYGQIQSKSEDPILIARTEEFFNVFLGRESEVAGDVEMNDDETPAQSIEAQPRARSRKSKPLSRALFDKEKANGSGSASRGTTPIPESAAEQEGAEAPGSAEQETLAAAQRTWFTLSSQHAEGSRAVSIVATPREDVSMADSTDKDAEEGERKEYHMYCNGNLYCFFRLFGTLYERLCLIYDAEREAKEVVEMQMVHKPAHSLGYSSRNPADFFDLEAIKNGGTIYEQVLERLLRHIQLPTEASALPDIEDMLRRYYLMVGYKLYHFDRLLGQMDRFASMMFSVDKDKPTEQLVQLFKKDRVKKVSTLQDETQYRRQAAKYLMAKDKADEPSYRVTYIETPVKAMYIQLIDKDSQTAAEAKEEEWENYIHNYQQESPTEGVDMQAALIKREKRWPILRRQIRELDDPNVCAKERTSFIIHANTYQFTVKSDYSDEIETADMLIKSAKDIAKLRKLAKRKYQKAVEEEERKIMAKFAETNDEAKKEGGADVEMADAEDSRKPEAPDSGHVQSGAASDTAILKTEQTAEGEAGSSTKAVPSSP